MVRTDAVMALPASASPLISFGAKTLWPHIGLLFLHEQPRVGTLAPRRDSA
jgi:hypothetical protein